MMKKSWFLIPLGIIIVIGITVLFINIIKVSESLTTSLEIVDAEKLIGMINNQEQMIIVDLREPELFHNGSVPTAINIPFENIQTSYTELPHEKKIVFVCHTGRMGVESGNMLIEKGYKQVYNLEGGMAKWTGDLQ